METKTRNANICEAYKRGETMCNIAKTYGITNARVSQILKENSIKIKRRSEYKNTYIDCGEFAKIRLSTGEIVLIDKQDIERVSQYSWCIGAGGRVVANVNNSLCYLHRFIIGSVGGVVDHINGNNRDNRRINLRITTPNGNAKNKVSKNKYGVNGIRKTPYGKYQARITVDYKDIHIGTFETLDEAIFARKQAEKKYFGEYAPTSRYN